MSEIKYHYAYNETGDIVSIEDVSDETRHEHAYHCIGCGGIMTPRLGYVRAHHFAHGKDDGPCSEETYLHKLGKYLIKRNFDESRKFEIAFYIDVKCKDIANCIFSNKEECLSQELITHNLKDFYDTCEEEKGVKGFVADLLLSNSTKPERKPVLIEIQVSHKSSPQKIDSGLRIIEIPIKTEDDIMNILSSGIKESIDFKRGFTLDKEPIGYAKFYNFKRDTISDSPLNKRTVQKFYLFKSGKAYIKYKSCSEAIKKDNDKAIFEACFNSSNFGMWAQYEFGYLAARQNGLIFHTCNFCKYYKEDRFGLDTYLCCMYKKFGTPQYPNPNEAIGCKYFLENRRILTELNKNLPPYVIAKAK